jgi:tetratricopeptide (TPR) repeat protein
MPISRFVYDPWELPPEQRQTTFVGREQFLDRFLGAIREQEGRATVQHYILTGPRGIGKTTLLLVLRDRIRQDPEISAKWFCVQLREEEYYVHKQRDLWQLVLQALAVDEKLAEARKVVDKAEEIRDEEKSSALLVDGLRSICHRYGKRLVLLIDNFDHIFPSTAAGEAKHRKPDSEYRAFRKRLSTEGFLMLIATSVKLFQDIYGYDKGFFHFFSPVELPELSQEEVAEMLRRLGQADENAEFLSRLERSKVNVQTLSVLTGGNPRLITMLYHILSRKEMGEPVQVLWETVAGLTPMLRQELADMPRQQSKTLDALLRLNGAAAPAEISKYSRLPLNVVTTQLGRLKAARYVALDGGGKGRKATYRVADQMFSVWYWMRYVPVARRRIELFIDFLRAWFSLEERRRLYQERLERFHSYQARGFAGLAQRSLRDAEYFAATFDEPTERRREMEHIADAYTTVGDLPSAAGLLAELEGTKVKSTRKFESLGYSVLASRLMAKGDRERALKTYSEALAKDPHDAETRARFGLALVLSARYAEAMEQFDQVPNRLRLKGVLPSTLLAFRGVARGYLGDPHGALADLAAVVDLPGAPVEIVAGALLERGRTKRELGDFHGAVADYTLAVELKGVPAEAVAEALVNRGIAERGLEDLQRAIADYTAAVKLEAAPPEQVARALVNRGIAESELDDLQSAITDYTAAVNLEGAPAEQVAKGLVNRGFAKGRRGDFQGAINDYTEVVDLHGAPAKYVALALISRGISRAERDDVEGAMTDYSALAALRDAPTDLVGMAMSFRGRAHGHLGQYEEALRDFALSLQSPGLPDETRMETTLYVGVALDELGRSKEALENYALCAQSGIMPFVHKGLQSTVVLLLWEERADEALGWVRRLHELEPREGSLETRLEARLDMIRAASAVASLEDASRLVDALLETDPEELRARLQFLKPGLELAKTKDESVLADLPEDERKIAREIARSLAEAARPPMGQPPS